MENKASSSQIIVGITGGIGAGKSIVSEILRTMGYSVYDCDAEAKKLMDTNEDIKKEIAARISNDVITNDGLINRKILSEHVFNDNQKLQCLNSIVHHHVATDIHRWLSSCERQDLVFVESAILHSSGFEKMMDRVIEVIAPEEIRITRVMRRNMLNRDSVITRIKSQTRENHKRGEVVFQIINDDMQPILPQILAILAKFSNAV